MNGSHVLTAVFAQTHVEERYFGYYNQTINGLNAVRLATTQDTSYTYEQVYRIVDQTPATTWGIRVWKRSLNGVETEITSGAPVALVSRDNNGEGLQSATWNCPEVNLAPTDSIIVRVYIDYGEGWQLLQTFTTEQLNAQKLLSSTWTVRYYTYYALRLLGGVEGDLWLDARFYHGGTYLSRIQGFEWAG